MVTCGFVQELCRFMKSRLRKKRWNGTAHTNKQQKSKKAKKNTQQLPEKESPEKELRIEPSKSNLAKLLLHLWGHTTSLLASLHNVEHAHQSIGGDVSRQNPRAVCFHCQREGSTRSIGP